MADKIMKSMEAFDKHLFKIGRVFRCWNNAGTESTRYVVTGKAKIDDDGDRYIPVKNTESEKTNKFHTNWKGGSDVQFEKKSIIKGAGNMLEKAKDEVVEFIGENKNVLYWFAIIFVADYYIFDGKFKDKLEHIFGSIIDKATSIINKADESDVIADS